MLPTFMGIVNSAWHCLQKITQSRKLAFMVLSWELPNDLAFGLGHQPQCKQRYLDLKDYIQLAQWIIVSYV